MAASRLFIVALLLCVGVIGCAPTDETADFRVVNPAPYNKQIDRGRPYPWTGTPLRIVEHLLGPHEKEAGPITYQLRHHSSGAVTLTVTQERVLDDEIYAERRVFTFVANDGRWSVQQVKVGYKCYPTDKAYSGRGCGR